jgi:hypothetical protein
MKKLSLSALTLAFAVIWAMGAKAASRKAAAGKFTGGAPHGSPLTKGVGGAIVSGKTRSFTTPAELKKNSTVPSGNGGGGPPSTGGSNGAPNNSANALSFSAGHFSRPLRAPIIKKNAPSNTTP